MNAPQILEWAELSGRQIDAIDRPGLLSEIMNVINEARVPTRSCKAWARKDRAIVKVAIEITDRRQLEDLMKKIRKIKNVDSVARMTHVSSSGS